MRYFIKESKKDKYGVERNLAIRSGRVAAVDAIPLPFVSQFIEPETKLLKKHPVLAVIGGQSGVLGAVDKNVSKGKHEYLPLVMITAAVGGAATSLPSALLGKWVKSQADKYYAGGFKRKNQLLDIAKKAPESFIGKRVNQYLKINTGSFPKVMGRWALITAPLGLAAAPLKYAIGYTFGKNRKPEEYKK